jgi:hypothetical protein
MVTYQGAHRYATYTCNLKFNIYIISLQNYAGSKQQLHRIMKILIFALLDKARHDIEITKSSNLVAVDQPSRLWL